MTRTRVCQESPLYCSKIGGLGDDDGASWPRRAPRLASLHSSNQYLPMSSLEDVSGGVCDVWYRLLVKGMTTDGYIPLWR